MNEHDLDHFDDLVQALSARASDTVGLDGYRLRTKLGQLFQEMRGERLTFDHLSTFTDSDTSPREKVCRKLAWTLQHALKGKVWCVNAKLWGVRSGRLYSPVIEQLKRVGLSGSGHRLPMFLQDAKKFSGPMQTSLDAVVLAENNRTIYVVKGCTLSSMQGSSRIAATKVISVGSETLFDPTDRIISDVVVDSTACRTLVLAWGVLKDAFNHLEVIPIYCVIDDLDAGWHFQMHDLTGASWNDFAGRRSPLQRFKVASSSRSFVEQFRADSDVFAAVPEWAVGQALYMVPPDRPARCLMNLDVLYSEQSGNAREIVPVKEAHLAEEVARRYDLFYTKDMRRHDLLHLTRRGLAQKHPGNSFSITPLGVARYCLAAVLTQEDVPDGFSDIVLSKVSKQAELVWKFRNL